jgi:hypothetical protein
MGVVGPEAGAALSLESDRDDDTFIPPRFLMAPNEFSDALRPNRTLSKTYGEGELIEPRPFRRSLMRDGAAGGLPDQTCIFCERSRPMSRRSRLPCLPARRKLALANEEVHFPCARINGDRVAIANQG